MTVFPHRKQEQETVDFFPFFSLPLELRHHIYSELLTPSIPSEGSIADPWILWHDRYGLKKHIPVHPQILLANRQVNAEGTTILYENNTFKINISSPVTKQCTGGMYADNFGSPQYLFRTDSSQRYFDLPGEIYPHCLQRIANIEIRLSTRAIWASTMAGYYFSHIGELFLEVLRVLAEDANGSQHRKETKKLLLTVHKEFDGDYVLNLFPGKGSGRRGSSNIAARKTMADQIPPLVEAVAEIRNVEILEVATFIYRDPPKKPTVRTRSIDLKGLRDL
ncbi:MAG: hypothetical protein Q9209_007273 [Squamulea sp. 1 TL-2023]